jgi:hypothetical protein
MRKLLDIIKDGTSLPDINLIEETEEAYAVAFLNAAAFLSNYLQRIETIAQASDCFADQLWRFVILELFAKLRRHYFSHALLTITHDLLGSRFLVEQIHETAITLIYLLEAADDQTFSSYIAAAIAQSQFILPSIEQQLQESPEHPDLLALRTRLQAFVAQYAAIGNPASPVLSPPNQAWGDTSTHSTSTHAQVLGLTALIDPSRPLMLGIVPGSFLDLQLHHQTLVATNGRSGIDSLTDFRCLRDTAHLCLHAGRSLLETIMNEQTVESLALQRVMKDLNGLFEWFHAAYCRAQPVVRRDTLLES